MPEPILRVLEQLRTLWSRLTGAQRIAILGVGGATPLVLLGLLLWGHRPDLTTLYSNLTPADAGAIVEQLKAARIAYRLDDGGTRILVPSSQVYETRIKLATAGLPQGGGVGFELFDRSNFGATDFVQKLNYQRALQGELARTIAQIREIQQARVHIVLPQPTVFSDREKPATASVVLGLRPGGRLGAEQVRAIVHLVSGSVEGLDADHVTVIDSAGRMLSEREGRGVGAGGANQLEYQQSVELELQRRVQSMLEEVLGPGKVSVRVAAQVEFSSGERTEERVDPNTVVRSEQRTTETTKGSSTRPSGVVGSTPNIGPQPGTVAGAASTTDTSKEQESIQYEVGRVVERRTLVAGEVKRLTVAVLVDPPYKMVPGPKGTERKVPQPRPAVELEKLRGMVMKAVGYTASRGDEVEVAELPFDTSAVDRERLAADQAERTAFWWSLVRPGVTGLLLLLALLFGLRPLLALLRSAAPLRPRPEVPQPALVEGAVAAQLQARAMAALNPAQMLKVKEREQLQGRVSEMARANPQQMAQLLRSWMVRK